MRTLRVVTVLVGIAIAVAVPGVGEAQTLGPLCAQIAGGPLNIAVEVFLIPTGGGQLAMTGLDTVNNRPLSGSAVTLGDTAHFQMTIAAVESTPTLFISGTVDLDTGNGSAICARNVQTNAGCGEGIPVTVTGTPC